MAYLVLLFVCAFAVGLGIGYAVIQKKIQQNRSLMQQETVLTPNELVNDVDNQAASLNLIVEEQEKPPAQAGYLVIEQQGKVCVFVIDENGTERFSHNLGIQVESLRLEDQKLLKEGIYLDSKQALLEFTEDFSS